MTRSHPLGRILAAAGAGAILALVGPPTNLYAAPWVGMAALAWLLDRPAEARPGRRLRDAFDGAGPGLSFGAGANLVLLRFVPEVIVRYTALPLPAGVALLAALAVLHGLAWACASVVAVQLTRRGVPAWVAFGAGVYASTFVPAVFPWTPAGPVSPVAPLIQLAEIVGERGVALVMALSAGLLAAGVRAWLAAPHAAEAPPALDGGHRRRERLAALLFTGAGLALPALTWAEGALRIDRVERDRARSPTSVIGLVQPSIEAFARWDPRRAPEILTRLGELTRRAEEAGAELTIWSEGAYPYPLSHATPRPADARHAVVGPGVRGPVLAGFVGLEGRDQMNCAATCTADGAISPPYAKLRLLAFGEEIPVVARIPWVKKTFARGFGLVPGAGNVVQEAGAVRASVLICVEDVLPESGREAMKDRPNLLANLTNDAWFIGSRESELHLRLAALRAVESRRDMVRAVNLGPTSLIDAAGVVRARYDARAAGVLVVRPALLEWAPTPYDRFGDVPVALALGAAIALGAARARRRTGVALQPPPS